MMNLASTIVLALAWQNPVIKPAPGTAAPTTPSTAAPVTDTYTNDKLGLAFDYPKDWKMNRVDIKGDSKFVITDPKTWRPGKTDLTDRFLIPLPEVDERAVLQIYSAIFNQDEDTWQTIQSDVNKKLKRQVVRQWSEELLGVPLLMTKIESNEKGLDTITETGLLYSATPRKLIFRLSASPANFDKADYAWRQVLQSLRTTNGVLPSAEDPNRQYTPADLNPGAYKKTIWTAADPKAPPVIKGDDVMQCISGGKQVNLQAPTGWKASKAADGSFVLDNPDLEGNVKLAVANILDSPPAGEALIHQSGITLHDFASVADREEKGPFMNRGDANVDWIFRRGTDSGGKPYFSFDSAGINGDDYWVLSWTGEDPKSLKKDRKALEDLVEVLHIVPSK